MSQTPALSGATALAAAGAKVTETSLVVDDPSALTWEVYESMGTFLGQLGRAYAWWVGDFLNLGEDVFGEQFAQIEAKLPHSPQTLANYKSVAKHVPRSRRRGLHLSVAAEVAYLPPPERDKWIEHAATNGWKREEMREARRAAKLVGGGPDTRVAILPPKTKTCPHCGHELEELQ